MTVGQHRRQIGPLEALGEQDGAGTGLRVGMDGDNEPETDQPGTDPLLQIAPQIRLVAGILRGAGDRHQLRQPVAQPAVIEQLLGAGDGGFAAHGAGSGLGGGSMSR